jgi:hypothetical protein
LECGAIPPLLFFQYGVRRYTAAFVFSAFDRAGAALSKKRKTKAAV